MKKDYRHINNICQELRFIITNTKEVSQEELLQNEILLSAIMFKLIQISENVKRLSEEYKIQHSTVPWENILGFRNRIVHDYGNVDLYFAYQVIKYDIPNLVEVLCDNKH